VLDFSRPAEPAFGADDYTALLACVLAAILIVLWLARLPPDGDR
jgi:uncharacterized membrane protein